MSLYIFLMYSVFFCSNHLIVADLEHSEEEKKKVSYLVLLHQCVC